MNKLFFFLVLISLSIAAISQSCLIPASALYPGYCDDVLFACDQKNFATVPDYSSDHYDYRIVTIKNYAVSQKFGSVDSNLSDLDTLSLNMLIPVNDQVKKPVIVYSPLSSFTNCNTASFLPQYIGSYFARKGYIFIAYESRKFNVPAADIGPTSEITDFIKNPHYTSDQKVIDDFRQFRNNQSGNYGFFDFIVSLNQADDNEELMTDAYYEMMYKNAFDLKYLLNILEIDSLNLNVDMENIFVMGGSAGSTQSMNGAFLDHPDDMDEIFKSDMLSYHGSSFPLEGRLKDDFRYEHKLMHNIKPKGVVNLWGRLSSLNVIGEDDPEIISIHGTWDDVFPYQNQKSSVLPDVIPGIGAEGIYIKARESGRNPELISVCQGGHTLYPTIQNGCMFPDNNEKSFFDSVLSRINNFTIDLINGDTTEREIISLVSPKTFSQPANFNLIPASTAVVADNNYLCPEEYPRDFNKILYGLEASGVGDEDSKEEGNSLNFQLYTHESLYPAFISFDLETYTHVRLLIFNLQGQIVKSKDTNLTEGSYLLPLDWVPSTSGMYHFVLITDTEKAMQRSIFVE